MEKEEIIVEEKLSNNETPSQEFAPKAKAATKAPLFHIVKRHSMPVWKSLLIRSLIVIAAIVVGVLLTLVQKPVNIFEAFYQLYRGSFGSPNKFWEFLKQSALLLGVSLALIPAFKMKFWNLGGNGQILAGALTTIIIMIEMRGMPAGVVIPVMILSAILAGALWAVIPAIFKALFNTNETLFTLMMNYVAAGITSFYVTLKAGEGKTNIPRLYEKDGYVHLPKIFNGNVLTIIVIGLVLAFIVYYLRFSKHGYELTVVGESRNTARYVGINVKKVVIRTLILSGALCGLVGCLISGAIDFSVNATSTNKNMGFTAIMAVWLADFNPLISVGTSFFITFISIGMSNISSHLEIHRSLADIALGIVYFSLIASEFFIEYKVIFNKKEHKKTCLDTVNLEPKPQETKAIEKEDK